MRAFTRLRNRIAPFVILAWAFFLPLIASAQNASSIATQKGLENPLKFSSVEGFVEGFLRAIVMIAIPLITIFIVWAGFLFISARGKPGQLTEAKNNFTYVIMGAILILSAWVLATLIGGTVRQLLG